MGEGEEENYQPPPEKSIDALMEADQVSIICSMCCSKQSLPSQKKRLNLSSRKEIGFNCSPQDDEALQKYKMALLGQAAGGSGTVVVDESDPRKVIFEQQPFSLTLSLIR